jgi:hypothetical protein
VSEGVIVALIAATASLMASGIGVVGVVISSRVRRDIATGNGHSIGVGVARLEDRAHDHEQRLDRIEVFMREHLAAHQDKEGAA